MIVHTFIFSKNIFEIYYCWYFHNILHKWIYTQTKHFTWLIVVYWDSVRRKYLMYTQIHDPSSTLYCIHCIEQWIRDLSIGLKIKLVGKFQIKWKLESYVFHWHTPLEDTIEISYRVLSSMNPSNPRPCRIPNFDSMIVLYLIHTQYNSLSLHLS